MKRTTEAILLIFLFVNIVYGIILYRDIKSKEALCVTSPLEYGVQEYSKAANAELNCACFWTGENSQRLRKFNINLNGTQHILNNPLAQNNSITQHLYTLPS